ncbi:hypothetical protein XENOCAPTIV_010535 [Xenoophorus captivus]|uniref:Uncharacterized protein n=1 Tax=Xenoophorus captivus TaxID=1517983 RepID=A0ABV0QSC2_9TELE
MPSQGFLLYLYPGPPPLSCRCCVNTPYFQFSTLPLFNFLNPYPRFPHQRHTPGSSGWIFVPLSSLHILFCFPPFPHFSSSPLHTSALCSDTLSCLKTNPI